MNVKPFIVAGVAFLAWKAAQEKGGGVMSYKRAFVQAIWRSSQRAADRAGWPRDLIVTAAVHESDYGRSNLAAKYHNLFGFKANKSWLREKRPVAMLPTWEFVDGKNVKIKAPFRAYASWEESIEDYVSLIKRLSRYRAADEAAMRGDAVGYFEGLQRGGYATDPLYARKLAKVHRSVEAAIV